MQDERDAIIQRINSVRNAVNAALYDWKTSAGGGLIVNTRISVNLCRNFVPIELSAQIVPQGKKYKCTLFTRAVHSQLKFDSEFEADTIDNAKKEAIDHFESCAGIVIDMIDCFPSA